MTKTQIAALSFIVPIAGIVIFFNKINTDKPVAVWALIWAMVGLTLALIVLMLLVL